MKTKNTQKQFAKACEYERKTEESSQVLCAQQKFGWPAKKRGRIHAFLSVSRFENVKQQKNEK